MKQQYYIGDLEFKTKKECENYTRNIKNITPMWIHLSMLGF